jgi:hypothetical protein
MFRLVNVAICHRVNAPNQIDRKKRKKASKPFGFDAFFVQDRRSESATLAWVWNAAGDQVARAHAVAVIDSVDVHRAEGAGDGNPTLLAAREAGNAEGLVQHADRVGDVDQFRVHGDGDTAQADDDAQDTNCQDQDEFGGNDYAGFVIPEFLHMSYLIVFVVERSLFELS